MALNYLSGGLGGATGDSLVTAEEFVTNAKVYWVSSLTGSALNSGLDREHPKASLATVSLVAAEGDTIVLMDGHTETIAGGGASILIPTGAALVGEGRSGGKPTAKLRNDATGQGITVGIGAEIRNVFFEDPTASNTSYPTVSAATAGWRLIDCYFECGPNTGCTAFRIGAGCGSQDPDYALVRGCTFISTATTNTAGSRPAYGVWVTDQADHLWLDGCVFDDGVYGFDNDYAYYAYRVAAAVRTDDLKITDCSLLRGASMYIDATNSVGYRVSGTVSTGGGRIYYA